jgi:transcriptional regulator with XRE-family HTH domain
MEMQADARYKQPNHRLRYEREVRGWTQQYVAEQLGAEMNIVSRWECGERKPGPYYRQKLSALFGKSAEELGLVEQKAPPDLSSSMSPHAPSIQAVVPGSAITSVEADRANQKSGREEKKSHHW